jgi:hypothetical protein
MTLYKAVAKMYGPPEVNHYVGQVIEGTKMYKDESGSYWILYTDQSEEPEWVMIDETTLEETGVDE